MTNDFDQIVEKHFKEKRDIFGFESIVQLIEEVMDNPSFILEGDEDTSKDRPSSIPFPVIKITELWGRTTPSGRNKSADRKRIEKFTTQIPGRTVAEKLEGINNVIEYNPRIGLPRIMSTLVFMELMRSIVVEYTEAVSGFLFEGFLAGLFGGKSVQVTDVKGKESAGQVGKPITDVELNGRHYSLKLLSPKTVIEGSFRNLVHHFEGLNEVVYLTLRKEANDILKWYEFSITLPTFVRFIGHAAKGSGDQPILKTIKVLGSQLIPIGTTGQIEIDGVERQIKHIYPEGGGRKVPSNLYASQGQKDPEGTYVVTYDTGETEERLILTASGQHIWGVGDPGVENYRTARKLGQLADKTAMIKHLKTVPGYADKAAQFKISRAYMDGLVDQGQANEIGVLDLSEGKILGVAEQYAAELNAELVPMYSALDSFTKNINSYFLTGKRSRDRLAHADAASDNAKQLESQTRKIVEGTGEVEAGEA